MPTTTNEIPIKLLSNKIVINLKKYPTLVFMN